MPKNHKDLYQKTLALSGLCLNSDDASQLTYTNLKLWWSDLYPGFIVEVNNEFLSKNVLVQEFAQLLKNIPFVEAAFWLSCGYATWVGTEIRKLNAMFFTPPKLAEHVINTLVGRGASLENHRWFDPACGGAAFIVPLAIRIRDKLRESKFSPDKILDIIENNIFGIDIDYTLQKLSSMYVRAVVYDETVLTGRNIEPRIKMADTLRTDPNSLPDFDILVCNPPYRKLSLNDRKTIFSDYLLYVEGQHNLYGVFISAAIKASKENNLLALLTPTSYMSGLHFSKLRKYITDSAEVLQIDMFSESDNTFVQVEQGTAVLYAEIKDKKTREGFPVNVISDPETLNNLGNITLSINGDPWYIPRSAREYLAFKNTSKSKYRLSDYGYVAKIGSLVWNRDQRKQLLTSDDITSAIFPIPVVWSSNITANGKFEFGRVAAQKNYFSFIESDNTKASGVIREECVILQRVTSSDQPRRLVGAVVPKEFLTRYGYFIAENHVVTLIPITPKISPTEMVSMLMTEHVDALFRCVSGTVGVTVYELNKLPLPDPKILRHELVKGKLMSEAVNVAFEFSILAEEK